MTQIAESQEVQENARSDCNDVQQFLQEQVNTIRENYKIQYVFLSGCGESYHFDIIIPHGLTTRLSVERLHEIGVHIVIYDVDYDTRALRLSCWISKGDVQ